MMIESAKQKLFKSLEAMEYGTLTLFTPEANKCTFEGKSEGPDATIHVYSWKVLTNLLLRGDTGFAEDYRAGKWDSPDLAALISLAIMNKRHFTALMDANPLWNAITRISYYLRLNTLKGSKRNIHAHYDLGNNFYKLWLDPSMTYSSALYKEESEDIVSAQMNKYDRMIEAMDIGSGRVLEVGCGWGGFAERALQQGDYDIKGITLSQEQHDYARERLGHNAQIALEDYREQKGKFDNIISIEMFEAVGEKFWQTYFNKVSSLLHQKGKAVIQTITMNETEYPAYRKGTDFIRSYIFPGGMLPAPSVFEKEAAKQGLRTENKFFFGQDYAKTLEVWLDNFDKKRLEIMAQGFDEGFIRLWRFYLASCIAGFRTGHTNVMQVELAPVRV